MTHGKRRILTLALLSLMLVCIIAGCGALGGNQGGGNADHNGGGSIGGGSSRFENCNGGNQGNQGNNGNGNGGNGGGGKPSGGEQPQPQVCDHVFGDWVIIKEPTCKEEGSQKRECTLCGEEQKQTLAKVNHDAVTVSETPATCTTTGLKEIHCRFCDKDFSEVTPALGHDYEVKSETKATCESQGEKEYACTRAGCTAAYTEVIPALGHDYEFVKQTSPTCTEKGEIIYECANCGGKKTITIDETGHDFDVNGKCLSCGYESKKHAHDYKPTVVAPTCSSVGYTYYECSCGLSYKADYIEQLTHLWDDGTVTKEETCTKDGVKQYSCTRVGCTAKYDEVIKAGHNWSETQTEPATCLYDGKKYKTCLSCGAEDVEILPAGHKWQVEAIVKQATCTEKGKERRTCTVCGEFDDFEVPALGHEYKNGVCTRCGEKFIDNVTPDSEHPTYGMYFVIDDIKSAYGPNIINEYGVLLYVNEGAKLDRVAVYLTQDGNMWRRCIACTGENIEFAVYVPYLSYYEDIYYTGLNNGGINTFALTKGKDGIWRYSEYATIGVNLEDYKGNLLLSLYDIGQAGAKTRIFDNLEQMKAWLKGYDVDHVHTPVTDEAVAATCEEGGYTAGSHCSVCGEVIKAREYIPALGHNYGEWKITTEATCEKEGVRTSTCTRCNAATTAKIPAIGHDYAETERKNATCENAGYIKYECANKGCGKQYQITLAAGSHEWTVSSRVDATCEKAGQILYVCSVCKDEYTETIPAGSHSYALVSEKHPTKLEAGYKKYKCSNCGDEYSVELPMLKSGESNVLLVQDRLPWDSSANATMLKALADNGYIGGWNVITSSQLSTIELYNYDLVYVANDQTTSTYNNIKAASAVIAEFAENGGAVIYGSADHGWASGEISYTFPGGVGKTNYYSNYNYIMDSVNPVVTAELTGGTALTDSLLYNTYCSHTSFTNLPEGANVILVDGKGNPTLVEYDYGSGFVMLSGLTWEHAYLRNLVGSTSFAKCVYDDMIVYALNRVADTCEHVLDNGFKYPASCGVQGYTLYTCCKCGKVFKKNIIPALEHNYGDWIIDEEATCAQEGLRHKKCANCGDLISEKIDKTEDHVPEVVKGYAATCTTFGKTDGSVCSVPGCGKVLKEQETIDKLEHNYGAWISNGNGTHTKTCSRDRSHTVTENCNYVSGACTVCGAPDPNYVTPVPVPGDNYTISPDGKYIYFGSYPQSLKEDSVTITDTVNAKGYYLGSDGEYYEKVTARKCDSASKFANGESVVDGQIYYFKVEPLKWRILTKDNGKAFLFCESIIDVQSYLATYTYNSDDGEYYNTNDGVPSGTYANNYEYSDIKAWLNEDFLNKAFTAAQQALIQTTLVDNSARSTSPSSTLWNNGVNDYACADTSDKIFLLSEQEITNSDYGFSTSTGSDSVRAHKPSDYAAANNLCMYSNGNGYFWLRSPSYRSSYGSRYVGNVGHSDFSLNVYNTYLGVVPALWLDM